MKKNLHYVLLVAVTCILLNSCKKENTFLDAKPNQALFVPSTLSDLENILNDQNLFNSYDPALGSIASDEYYVTADNLNVQTTQERNGYIWAVKLYDAGANINDWTDPYQQIYYANTVLDYLPKVSVNSTQKSEADKVKASALFFRAIAFYNLVQTFAMPYDSKTASTDLGIPLRLTSDINAKSVRASNQACYEQIINDLQTAAQLLPIIPAAKTLPSQPAANALLARVYLAMADFPHALQYSGAALSQFNKLTDYNTLTPNGYTISSNFLDEDIFHTVQIGYDVLFPNYIGIVDSTLYNSYTANDLRKSSCFVLNSGLPYFSGTYDFNGYDYSGIATDEIYLIHAECNARAGNTSDALKDLNTLLVTRWQTGTFVPYTATSSQIALNEILLERRKELLFRGLRWTDLRRLNKESQFAVTLKRVLNGTTYSLPPNDPRYAMPIPDNEISLSGIQQNQR
jgi:hypothetical protein